MPHVVFLIIAFIWSASFLLMKFGIQSYGPVGIAGFRCLTGGIVLGVILIIRDRRLPKIQDWPGLGFLVFFAYLWPYSVQPVMVEHLNSGFVGMMVSLVPLLTILVSVPMLRIRPTLRQFIGVLIGLVCMGVLMADKIDGNVTLATLLLAATVPLTYAIGNTWNKRRFPKTDPLVLACVAMLGGAVFLIPLALATEEIHLNDGFAKATGAILLLGALGTGAAMGLFYWLIQNRGPLFAGMVTYLIPIGAVILGWLDREEVSWIQIAALAGILITVAITQYGPVQSRETSASVDPGTQNGTS